MAERTSRRDFHRAAFHHLEGMLKIFSNLDKDTELKRTLDAAPEALTKGRLIAAILIDDLIDAFAFTMRDVARDEIPLSFYKQLLNARRTVMEDSSAARRLIPSVTTDEAFDDLLPRVETIKAIPGQQYKFHPDSLELCLHHLPKQLGASVAVSFTTILNNMRLCVLSDSAISAMNDANVLMIAVSAIMKTAKEKNDAFQAVGITDTPDAPAKEAEESEGSDDEAIDNPLDEYDVDQETLDDLITHAASLDLSPAAKAAVKNGIGSLKNLPENGSEYATTFRHVRTILNLPWGQMDAPVTSIKSIQKSLDHDHFGMDEVKERILEFIATLNHTGGRSPMILCLDGPPGVGKTSIAKSVANAMSLKYGRVSMGGVHGEDDIRGHTRTYVGALPGKIMHAIQEAGSMNPILNLDEIDKLGESHFHGDPAAALLEVLDPEQNGTFRDNYLGIPFDLSRVIFICTSNNYGKIPDALRDRMETIHLSGYTREERMMIAKNHLLKKQMALHNLNGRQLKVSDDALHRVVSDYVREAGVRGTEKIIKKICRRSIIEMNTRGIKSLRVTAQSLDKLIGAPPPRERHMVPDQDTIGHVNGLAYTSVGGCTLPIQAIRNTGTPGGLRASATGLLGKTMMESTQYAAQMVQNVAEKLGLDRDAVARSQVHLHAPAAAIPKDGPSAGIAIATAMISVLSGVPVKRSVAMTGEVDIFGNVLPIGGVREKLDGAVDAGITTVLIPVGNAHDIAAVPPSIRNKLTIIPVQRIEQVLEYALSGPIPRAEPKVDAPTEAKTDTAPPPPSSPVKRSDSDHNAAPSPEEIRRVFQWMAAGGGYTNDNDKQAQSTPAPGQNRAPG